MANKPLKVNMIGYGAMARYHVERMKKSGIMEIVGSYDIWEQRQREAEFDGFKVFPTSDALVHDPDCDIVLITTPNDFHCEYAIAAANAGKHVICEKPVALSVDELNRMEKAAKDNGVLFTVHQNRRWDDDFLAIRKIVESGVLGKIYRIDSFVTGANGIPGGWRKIKRQGGGMMLDWGVHLLDQIFQMIEAKPLALWCKYSYALGFDVDDGFDAKLDFEGDLTVNVRVDTNTFVKMPRWIVYGRDGTATIEDWDLNGKIILPVYGKEVEIVGIEAGNGYTRTMAYRPHESVTESPIVRPEFDRDIFYKNFAAAVRGKERQKVSIESVRKILRVMELCKISAEKNIVIKDELKNI